MAAAPAAHAQSAEALFAHFSVDPAKGLSSAQVDKARTQYGQNGALSALFATPSLA